MHKPILIGLALAALLAPSLALAQVYYADTRMSCAPAYPVVSLGNSGRFVAVTNAAGPFQWTAPNTVSLVNAGSVFVAPMTQLGTQRVTVTWGTQQATCYVQVVPEPGYGEATNYSNSNYPSGPLGVTLSSSYYPRLPNTGFEPITAAAWAFAAVLLIGASIALYPHVRKAFTVVIR